MTQDELKALGRPIVEAVLGELFLAGVLHPHDCTLRELRPVLDEVAGRELKKE